jgi:MSHA pilin protein MshC
MLRLLNKGFTLIELIVVIVIMAILSIFIFPSLIHRNINVAAQADQLVSDLIYTRTLSLTSGERYHWVKLSANTYQIQNSSGNPIVYPGTGLNTISLSSNITFGTLSNLPNSSVAFDGKGTPYVDNVTPGTILTSLATIALTDGSSTKTVAITPSTGWIYQP